MSGQGAPDVGLDALIGRAVALDHDRELGRPAQFEGAADAACRRASTAAGHAPQAVSSTGRGVGLMRASWWIIWHWHESQALARWTEGLALRPISRHTLRSP